VTLKLMPPGGIAQASTVRLAIKDRIIQRMPTPAVDTPATVRAILKDYNLEHLRAEDAFRGMQYFETIKDADLQVTWAHAWLAGRETLIVPADDVMLREALAVARVQYSRKSSATRPRLSNWPPPSPSAWEHASI